MTRPQLVDDAPAAPPAADLSAARDASRARRFDPARLLFPGLVVAMGAFAVSAPTWSLAERWGLPATAEDALLTAVVATLFYLVITLLERWRPHRDDWARPHGDVTADVLHLTFTGPGTSALFDATVRGAAVGGGAWLAARLGAPIWPTSWPAPLQLVLAISVAELGHYAFHRLSHERPLVWRLHATHHSAPRLYWMNATRFHPLDLFLLFVCQTTPLLVLGADRRAFLSYVLFSAVYGQLQHCNAEMPTGRVLDAVLSSPGVHRWHHSRDSREGNHNYAAIVNLWDHLFGTYFRPRDRSFAGPVGIEGASAFPHGYLGQLASPLRWKSIEERSRHT
jgi:ornithine lipid hydroxylase